LGKGRGRRSRTFIRTSACFQQLSVSPTDILPQPPCAVWQEPKCRQALVRAFLRRERSSPERPRMTSQLPAQLRRLISRRGFFGNFFGKSNPAPLSTVFQNVAFSFIFVQWTLPLALHMARPVLGRSRLDEICSQ
jgi:hypothetical protein